MKNQYGKNFPDISSLPPLRLKLKTRLTSLMLIGKRKHFPQLQRIIYGDNYSEPYYWSQSITISIVAKATLNKNYQCYTVDSAIVGIHRYLTLATHVLSRGDRFCAL